MNKYLILFYLFNCIPLSCHNDDISISASSMILNDSIITHIEINNNSKDNIILQSTFWQFEGIENDDNKMAFFPLNDYIVNSLLFYSNKKGIKYRGHKQGYPYSGNMPKHIFVKKNSKVILKIISIKKKLLSSVPKDIYLYIRLPYINEIDLKKSKYIQIVNECMEYNNKTYKVEYSLDAADVKLIDPCNTSLNEKLMEEYRSIYKEFLEIRCPVMLE